MTTARQVQVHVSGRSLKINIFRRLIANPWCSLKLSKIILCQCNLKHKKLYCLYPMYRTISTIMGHAFHLHPGAWFFSETDWYWLLYDSCEFDSVYNMEGDKKNTST